MLAKTKIAGFIVAAMALSAPMVYADPSPQDGGWHQGHKDHMMAKILNLTDDQTKQLQDLQDKQKTAMKAVFEQLKSNREAFSAEITKAAPDMNKVNDLQTQLKTIQSQMVDNHLSSLLDIKKIMTPEQFAGFMALKKERMMMRHHMMGHGKFGHKDGGKDWKGPQHDGDKGGMDHDSDE